MKVFSEESALQLSEMLLQNDKDIKTEIEGKIPSVEGLASEKYVDDAIARISSGGATGSVDIIAGYRDTLVIPDKYNTGCTGELVSMVDYFGSDYTEGNILYITSAIQSTYGTLYENIEFNNQVSLNKAGISSITFKNCRFSSNASYAIITGSNFESSGIEAIFENCEFLNQTSACIQPGSRIKMINCKIHDLGADGGKVFNEGSYENCYFYNIGFTEGAHADGIQITNANSNFSIINCRFDMPYYSSFIPNSAIFFCLEEDSYNSTIKDCVMNGGNYTMYYGRKYPDAETPVALENNVVENIIVGCSYRYGMLNDNSGTVDETEIKEASALFISSVYKDNGVTKLLVTNYTNSEKTLRVVTNSGESSYVIPACPLYADGLTYTSLSEFPFDIECTIEEDVDYVVCYDGDEQIRFVDFAGNGISNNSFVDLSNYYTKEEVDELIPTVKDGVDGTNGENGISPIVSLSRTTEDDGCVISITDVDGTKSVTVYDGADGTDGVGSSNSVVYISEEDYLNLVANETYDSNAIYVTEKSLLDGNEVSY